MVCGVGDFAHQRASWSPWVVRRCFSDSNLNRRVVADDIFAARRRRTNVRRKRERDSENERKKKKKKKNRGPREVRLSHNGINTLGLALVIVRQGKAYMFRRMVVILLQMAIEARQQFVHKQWLSIDSIVHDDLSPSRFETISENSDICGDVALAVKRVSNT